MATELKLNGIPKNGGFLLSNKGPIDVRTVVTEYSHLSDLISGNRGYVGMLVYVNSNDNNKGLYICESITDGGSWKPVATSSSTGDISLEGYATEKYVDEAIENIDIPEVDLGGYSKIDHTHTYKPSFSKSIYHDAGGTHAVNFLTVDYSSYDGNKGTYFKLDATCCHGNGVSYQFLEEIVAGVTSTGNVSLAINKSCQQECSSFDGRSSYYGDVFAVKDETNKKVHFYILGGQWCNSLYTDLTPIGSATIEGVTQHTGYMSSCPYATVQNGEKIWALGCGNTCHDYLPLSGGNIEGPLSARSFSTDGTVSANMLSASIFKSDETEAALQFSHSNEVNFGSNGDTIYLGYQNRLSTTGAVSKYNFGCSNGDSGARGGTIYCGDVYVDNGTTKVSREHSHPYLKTDTSGEQSVLGVINAAGFKGNSFSSPSKGTSGPCLTTSENGIYYGKTAATATSEIATKADIESLIEISDDGKTLTINI